MIRGEYRNVEQIGDGRVRGEMKSANGEWWYGFEARIDLLRIRAACESDEASARIWAIQDGYGEPGFVPAQGWDWSGIRDSSESAIAAMDAVASEFVGNADLEQALGLTLS